MKVSSSLLGARFYNKKSNTLFRITKIRNRNVFIVKDEDNIIHKVTKDILDNDCVKLLPVGILSINQVDLGFHKQDVIVCLHRMNDIRNEIEQPFVACRQAIINMYSVAVNPIATPDAWPMGLCMSMLTKPENVDFNVMLECKDVIKDTIVSIYIDDTIDSILELVNTTVYDNTINDIKKHLNNLKVYKESCSSSLRGLLEDNSFMTEFNNAYGIINLNSKTNLFYKEDDDSMLYLCKDTYKMVLDIEDKIGYMISNLQIIRYNETVDLTRILGKQNFVLVRNNNQDNNIYIVKYDKGNKVVINRDNQSLDMKQLIDTVRVHAHS